MKKQPIGFFDSGVGGISVWLAFHQLLPNESSIYLADSKNAPYGDKSKEEIISFSVKNTEFLLNANCKLIVVACNTATTNAISYLRNKYQVPFVGIEPATKPAALNTQTKKIGILATKGTLASELFLNTSQKYRGDVEIIETIGTGLVKLIEEGKIEETRPLLEQYVRPMVEAGVDNIVLGCTHYPFLKPILKEIIPSHIQLIDSGEAVAKQTKKILELNNLLAPENNTPNHQFFSNTNVETLKTLINKHNNINGTIKRMDF
jgi:glutamate racemase